MRGLVIVLDQSKRVLQVRRHWGWGVNQKQEPVSSRQYVMSYQRVKSKLHMISWEITRCARAQNVKMLVGVHSAEITPLAPAQNSNLCCIFVPQHGWPNSRRSPQETRFLSTALTLKSTFVSPSLLPSSLVYFIVQQHPGLKWVWNKRKFNTLELHWRNFIILTLDDSQTSFMETSTILKHDSILISAHSIALFKNIFKTE